MEEDYFERFLKHSKKQCTNAQKCDSERPITSRTAANTSNVNDFVLSQEGAAQTHLTSWQIARKRGIHPLSAVRIIRDDLRLQVWEKNDAHRSYSKPKQIVSTFCYKINLSWYPVSSKLASYTWEHSTLETQCVFCVPKIVDIDQYLLESFENITGVRFLEPQCICY